MPPTLFPPGLAVGAPNANSQVQVTGTPPNLNVGQGYVTAVQGVIINQNSTNVVTSTITIPTGEILDIIVDVLTAFNSATSATLTVGLTAGGTEFASGVDARTAGRVRPTFTTAQLAVFPRTSETVLQVTVTPVGATSAGQVRVTVLYETA